MKTIDRKIIERILDHAKNHPFCQVRFVVDGFGFHVYFDDSIGFFEVSMFFSPSWGHSHGFSSRTNDEFFVWMERLITDAKKIYVDGGKYPDNYYDRDCGAYFIKN